MNPKDLVKSPEKEEERDEEKLFSFIAMVMACGCHSYFVLHSLLLLLLP